MGMFFWVKKDDNELCPYCGEELEENYQSKDDISGEHDYWGGCCERHSEPCPTLEKSEVGNFYTICNHCKKWINYRKNEPYTLIED